MDYIAVVIAVLAVIFLIYRYNRNKPADEKPNLKGNIIGVIVLGFIVLYLLKSCNNQAEKSNDAQVISPQNNLIFQ